MLFKNRFYFKVWTAALTTTDCSDQCDVISATLFKLFVPTEATSSAGTHRNEDGPNQEETGSRDFHF